MDYTETHLLSISQAGSEGAESGSGGKRPPVGQGAQTDHLRSPRGSQLPRLRCPLRSSSPHSSGVSRDSPVRRTPRATTEGHGAMPGGD